ncbi:MAG: ABC transporter permease [Lachnospiraceae bacterium]|nr:ABC transporter permease [Lachnospiraceae bacterium]
MKFSDIWKMSSGSLWKRKLRTILTILGVVIGTASIVVMMSLGLGLNRATTKEIEENGGLTTITVYEGNNMDYDGSSGTDGKLDDDLVESIRQIEHVKVVSPVLTMNVIAKYGSYESYLYLRGMDPDALAEMNIPIGQGSLPEKGGELKFLYGNQCIVDFYNSKTGDSYWDNGVLPDIDLMKDSIFVIFDTDAYWNAQYNDGSDSSEVVKPPKKYLVDACGIVAGDLNTYNSYSWGVYCDIDALKAQLKKVFKNKPIPGQPTTSSGKAYKELYYNTIYVNVDDMTNVKEVQSAITEMGYQAESNMEWVESTQKQYGYIQAVLGGIGAVSMLVAAISIANTMMMSIYERTKEIGVMKVLGCDIRNIQAMFLMEAGMIGLIGGIVGLILSFGISVIINIVVKSMGTDMQLSYIPLWLSGLSIVFAVLVGIAAGFFPSRRAMKLSPLAAIRNE